MPNGDPAPPRNNELVEVIPDLVGRDKKEMPPNMEKNEKDVR